MTLLVLLPLFLVPLGSEWRLEGWELRAKLPLLLSLTFQGRLRYLTVTSESWPVGLLLPVLWMVLMLILWLRHLTITSQSWSSLQLRILLLRMLLSIYVKVPELTQTSKLHIIMTLSLILRSVLGRPLLV